MADRLRNYPEAALFGWNLFGTYSGQALDFEEPTIDTSSGGSAQGLLRFLVASKALPPFSFSTLPGPVRIRHENDAVGIIDGPVPVSFPTELKLGEPSAVVVGDLQSVRRVHSSSR